MGGTAKMTEEAGKAAPTKTNLTPEQQSAVLYWPTKAKIPIIRCHIKQPNLKT